MTNGLRISSILIVGGGTAGWMSALYLRLRIGCQVTLVESPSIGPIGVGEATIPNLIDFLASVGLDEDVFLKHCRATYKLGIEFRDWVQLGQSYWHPFGLCGGNIDGLDLFHFWLKRRTEQAQAERYCHYSLQSMLCEQLKSHRSIGGRPVVANYAFHLDATALADMLSLAARQSGVRHLVDNVTGAQTGTDGSISQVHTTNHGAITADLYLDCTGFRGVLIEQALGDEWVDWSDVLLCDRAVVRRAPRDDSMRPYTISTAVEAGWIWQIPLRDQTGTGYVYSSRHTSDEQAKRLLTQYGGSEYDGDIRQLHMRVGHRQNFWRANCVAIGLAGGFIEPLESTGIFFIQRALEDLVEYFPDRSFHPTLIAAYNKVMLKSYEEVRDFIILHYILSQRDDTQFWRDSRSVIIPESLNETLEFYDANGRIRESDRNPVFRETNFYHVLTGGKRLPLRHYTRADFSDFDAVLRLLDKIRGDNEVLASGMPSHAEAMDWIHGR